MTGFADEGDEGLGVQARKLALLNMTPHYCVGSRRFGWCRLSVNGISHIRV